jgi:DNA-binding IclR family transcriptional regulator
VSERITRNPAEVMRDEMAVRDRILELLAAEPLTIPEIAEKLGVSTHETVRWVMAMWSYKLVEETGKAGPDGYYRYQVKVKPESGE